MTISRRQFVAGVAIALAAPTTAIAAKKEINKDFYGYGSGVIKFELPSLAKEQEKEIPGGAPCLEYIYNPHHMDTSRSPLRKYKHEVVLHTRIDDFLKKHEDGGYNRFSVERRLFKISNRTETHGEVSTDYHLTAYGRLIGRSNKKYSIVEHLCELAKYIPSTSVEDNFYMSDGRIVLSKVVSERLQYENK
jgi:hypothetical protein